MAIDLGDSTFRPLLRDDMIAAWDLLKVHYDAPYLPGEASDLPRGFIQIRNVEPGEPQGFSRRNKWHPYRLVGQFAYPASGTVEEARVTRVNELMDILTSEATSNIYKDDWRYRDDGQPFEDAEALGDPQNRIYHVVVDFALLWETGI
jgi:hypothetical protein